MMCFTCPRCGKISWNWNDAIHGWCGACKTYTAPPMSPSRADEAARQAFERVVKWSKNGNG